MKKIAKLVTISVQTRVIVDPGATEEEIIDKAIPKLIETIKCSAGENIEEIVDDQECPYGTYDLDEIE